jgi:hypothetical protein
MQVFIAEYWLKDGDEGRLKDNIETGFFNLTKDPPSSHEWTSGNPSDSSFVGMLEAQKGP